MPRPSGGFTRLQHAAIKVHDIEAAKDFYVNTLGFTVSEIFEPGTVGDFPFGLCFMRCTELHHDMNLIFWPEGEGPAPPEELSKIAYAKIGPTEARILLMLVNTVLWLSSTLLPGMGNEVRFVANAVVALMALAMFTVLVVRFGKNLYRLAKLEPRKRWRDRHIWRAEEAAKREAEEQKPQD